MGDRGSKYRYKWAIIGPGLVVSGFTGDPDQYCYKTLYFCDFSGGDPDPLSPTPSGSTYTKYGEVEEGSDNILVLYPRRIRQRSIPFKMQIWIAVHLGKDGIKGYELI